ncbi:type 1 glutamine amidotransferase [Shewanella waksmanii]|uniref:type 1 glutamine amidotransferase n=1 Tax=Shewanella waksmanii TaxID=213783 RepID=UPI0004B8CCC1|nr:type 1 glutamine amidotransferase [Shewanella waksmanii]
MKSVNLKSAKPRMAVLQHHHAEGVGRIGDWCQTHGIEYDCYFAPQDLPSTLQDYQGVIVLGGPMDVADMPSWMAEELRLIRQALALDLPLLSICLGAQLLAHAIDGQVVDMPMPELGWCDVSATNHGQQHPLVKRLLPQPFAAIAVPQWHYKQIVLPAHVPVLMTSAQAKVQMFAYQRAVGVQFHLEWRDAELKTLATEFGTQCPFHCDNTGDNLQPSRDYHHYVLDVGLSQLLDGIFSAVVDLDLN